MRKLIMAAVMWPGLALAQDWERLDDAGIIAALGDRTLRFDAYTIQHFGTNGATEFVTERAALGRWEARDGQYCSTWPPSDRWDCYDLELAGDQLRFISADGFTSQGAYAN